MDIIDRYRENKEILFRDFEDYTKEINFAEKRIKAWREKIKTCKV